MDETVMEPLDFDELCAFVEWIKGEQLHSDEPVGSPPVYTFMTPISQFYGRLTPYRVAVPLPKRIRAKPRKLAPESPTRRGCRVNADGKVSPFRVSKKWKEECIENGERVVYDVEVLSWGFRSRARQKRHCSARTIKKAKTV